MFLKNKKLLGLVALVLLLAGAAGIYWFTGPAKDRTVAVSVEEKVSQPDLALSFDFLSGADALSYTESAGDTLTDANLLKAFVLMKTEDQKAYLENESKMVPPAITILVFNKTDLGMTATSGDRISSIDYLTEWAAVNGGYTGYRHMVGETESTEIDNWTALRFGSELAYKQDTYISKYRDKVYLFVGQYEEEGDFMQQAFQNLVASVRLE